MKRRTLLAGVGTVTLGVLAGCVGGGSGSGLTVKTDSPTAVVESWHRLNYTDPETERERAAEVFHSDSHHLDTIESGEGQNYADNELDRIETELLTRDLGMDALYSRAGGFHDNGTLRRMATEEQTARVQARLEFTTEGGQTGTPTWNHLVVTENGQWQILLLTLPQ